MIPNLDKPPPLPILMPAMIPLLDDFVVDEGEAEEDRDDVSFLPSGKGVGVEEEEKEEEEAAAAGGKGVVGEA